MKRASTILLMVFVVLSAFAPLYAKKVMAENGEVKFIGVVFSNEVWEPFACYGAYESLVVVHEIISDPEGLLIPSFLVPICYGAQLGLAVGELVECCGFYWRGICPLQCCEYCDCGTGLGNGSDYYVIRADLVKNLDTNIYYGTIQDAINANETLDGHTIFVRNGTYFEHVVVNKTLTLQGENRNTTIIDGEYLFASVVNVTANNVKFSGFTIQHCSDGGRALWLDNCGNMTFSDNIITGCNEGVRLHRSSGNVVSENIVQDCYYNTGVGIDYGINNTVHRNIIINNHYGISGGIDCHGNTFSENTIINNDVGFGTTSYDNKFFHNNFVNNSVNVIASGVNQFDDGYHSEGNYWSDYNGTDLNGDGIGDTPYIINGNNQDNYPLMNLYWNAGDIDHDLDVDIFDVVKCSIAYGSTPLDPNWNPHCDIAEPYGIINIFDIVTIAISYGEEYTP